MNRSGERHSLTTRINAALHGEVARLEPAALDLLRILIRTPSVTGDEGNHRSERSVAGQLWASLENKPGVLRYADPVFPNRDNIIAVVSGNAERVMVLDAHTDTVPAGESSRWFDQDPFSASDGMIHWLGEDRVLLQVGESSVERPVRRRLGKLWEARSFSSATVIYGRGAFDNKGPIAVAWLATMALCSALERANLMLDGTLVTAFVVDEEESMAGTRALVANPDSWLARHDLLSGDMGGDELRSNIVGVALDGSYGFVPVVGHRGVAQMVLRTSGQAAHAATPDLGRNAVTRMAFALHALELHRDELAARLAPLFEDVLLEPATLAIGTTIAGGGVSGVTFRDGRAQVARMGVNVIPDWCEATIDCRFPRPADGDVGTIRNRIAATILQFVFDHTGLGPPDLIIDSIAGSPLCAILDRPEDGHLDSLVGPFLRHGAMVSGFDLWVETAPGGTDATVMINEGRIRTLVEFGPAGAFSHEPHEFVERDQIAVGALILALSIVDILGVREPLPL